MKKVFIACLLVCMIFAISNINAADSDVELIASDNISDTAILTDIHADDNLNEAYDEEILSDEDDGSFTSLADKIHSASENSVIELTRDYVWSDRDQMTNGTLITVKNLTIDGKNHIIDAKGNDRIFVPAANNIVLKNIVFMNGKATPKNVGWAGAILWDGDYGSLINCTFINNTVDSDTYNRGSAGAVLWNGYYGTMINTTFINNHGTGHSEGGAVVWDSMNGKIENTKFINNTHTNLGGALYLDTNSDNTIVSNCTFINNFANRFAGAIGLYHRDYIKIIGCTFLNNTATYAGGAIYYTYPVSGDNYVDIIDCTFKDNTANGNDQIAEIAGGGAICIAKNGTITNCTFIDNTALYSTGGAVFWFNGEVNITKSVFINNTASELRYSTIDMDIGIIKNCIILSNTDSYLTFLTPNVIADYNWWGNTADDYNKKNPKALGLNINKWYYLDILPNNLEGYATVSLNNVYDSQTGENYTYDECSLPDYIMDISSQNLILNTSKVTLKNGEAHISMNNVIYPASITVKNGSEIYTKWIKLGDFDMLQRLIDNASPNSVIVLPRDYTYTVGLDSIRYGIKIDKNLVIDGNGHTIDAKHLSRIFDIEAYDVTFKNINFVNGLATTGGAILLWDSNSESEYNFEVDNCTFENNTANYEGYYPGGYGGGAIYAYSTNGNYKIKNSQFINNDALNGCYGGAIYLDIFNTKSKSSILVYNSVFDKNSAKTAGAIMLYTANSQNTIDKSVFTNNIATSQSTVLMFNIGNDNGLVNNSIFISNDADLQLEVSNGNVVADNNWWGSTADNYTNNFVLDVQSEYSGNDPNYVKKIVSGTTVNNWLFLNASAKPSELVLNQISKVRFFLQSYDPKTGKISDYNIKNIHQVNMSLSGSRGNPLTDWALLGDEFEFQAHNVVWGNGSITASYNDVGYTLYIPISIDSEITVYNETVIMYVDQYMNTYDIADLYRGNLKYESDNPNVAVISGTLVKAVGEGTAKIKITYAGSQYTTPAEAEATIIVKRIPTTLTLNVSDVKLQISDVINIGHNISIPREFNWTSKPDYYIIKYNASAEEMISVDSNDNLRVLSSGKVTVTAYYPGDNKYLPSNASFTITVNKLPSSINVNNNKTISLHVDDTHNINAAINISDFNIEHGKFDYNGIEDARGIFTTRTVFEANGAGTISMSTGGFRLVICDENNNVISSGSYNSNFNLIFDGNGNMVLRNGGTPQITGIPENFKVIILNSDEYNAKILTSSFNKDSRVNVINTKPNEATLTYTSSNEAVATVDGNGKITAVGEGTAVITINWKGTDVFETSSETVTVNVKKYDTVIIADDTIILNATDEDKNINATIKPFVFNALSYSSSNISVVSVNNFGDLTVFGAGFADISIRFEGNNKYAASSKTVRVIVNKLSTEITADTPEILIIGGETNINATLNPNIGVLTYESSDENIVKVSIYGKITAVGAGSAIVTVRFDGNSKYGESSKKVNVLVKKIPTIIYANNTYMNFNESVNLNAAINHEGNLEYVSSDNTIVSVDEKGNVTALKGGIAEITVTFKETDKFEGAQKTIIVSVARLPNELDNDEITLNVFDSFNIKNLITDADGANFEFSLNTTGIISIDDEGNVTALAGGTVNVTVKFDQTDKYEAGSINIIITVKKLPTSIIVNADDLKLGPEESTKIFADISSSNPNHKPDMSELNWKVVNSTVISFSNGDVAALSQGKASIIVSFDETPQYEASTKTITVTVSKIPTSISVTNDKFNLLVGDTDYIGAVLSPVGIGDLIYEVSNSSVVSVDSKTGKITALNKGTATITVKFTNSDKYEDSSKTIIVNVDKSKTQINVNSTFTLNSTGSVNINALLNISDKYTLNYQSQNTSVASVDSNGLITAVNGGKTTIKITFDETDKYYGSQAEVTVIINKLDSSIEITDDKISLLVGEDKTISSVITPSDAKVTYGSSNEKVVKVDGNGKITAVGEGSATVTVKVSENGKYHESTKTLTVSVNKIKTAISVDDAIIINPTEKNRNINAVLNISDDYRLTYEVEDNSIIRVSNGLITPLSEGSTTVLIKYAGNDKYASSSATVKVTVEKISTTINADSEITLTIDDSVTINPTVSPVNGKVTYEIEDSGIIKINDDGTITALAAGKTNLIIRYAGTNIYSQSNITVPVTVVKKDVKINQSEITLNVNDKFDIKSLLDYDKNDEITFTYYVSNSEMLSITENGIITALGQKTIGSTQLTYTYIIVQFNGNDKYNKIDARANTVKVNIVKLPSEITVNDTITISVGEELNINAILNHEGKLTYMSFNESVFTVDENGIIKGISVGSNMVYVGYPADDKYNTDYKYVTVNVVKAQTVIKANETVSLHVGENTDLGAVISPSGAGSLSYVSNDTGVVRVDSNGKITATGKGTAKITITFKGNENYGDCSKTVIVNVDKTRTSIKVNGPIVLNVGENADAGAVLSSSGAGSLSYVSNDTGVVRVDSNGKITATGKGTAKITVRFAENSKYYGSSAEITVTVDKTKTSITVNSTFDLGVGESVDLKALITPDNAGNVIYESSNNNVVKVDNNGKITAVGEGTAKITVKFAENNKYYASQSEVTVKVSKIKTAITVNSHISLNVGKTANLNATLKPDAGKLTYTSSNPNVLTVDENGNVKAVSEGTAKVTIRFIGDDKYTESTASVDITVTKQDNDNSVNVEVAEDTGVATITLNTPGDATGNVIVTVNGKEYTAQIKNGKATVTIDDLETGDYVASVNYPGDNKHSGVNKQVNIHIPNIKIDKNKNTVMFYYDGTQYLAHLTSDTKALSGKTIIFKVNGKTYKRTTDKYGYANLTINLPPKTYTITAEYRNIKVTNKITVKHVIKAKNLSVKKSAKSLKIKVTLKAKKVLKNKKVTLKFKGKTYTAKTNKKGIAIFTIPKKVIKKLAAGKKHTYKVTYIKSSVKKYITVKK